MTNQQYAAIAKAFGWRLTYQSDRWGKWSAVWTHPFWPGEIIYE